MPEKLTLRPIFFLLFLLAIPALPKDDPALALLKKFNWQVEKEETLRKVAFSKELKGNPELFYQNASVAVGLDLKKAKGEELLIRHFLLKERGSKESTKFWAAVALHKGQVVGAWIYTDAPIAPGIFSLKDKSMLQEL